jgi:hypothetical protein
MKLACCIEKAPGRNLRAVFSVSTIPEIGKSHQGNFYFELEETSKQHV